MPGKHQAPEPSWRPLAQKLSGLIRHGSTKTKKPSAPTDEKSSTSRFKRQKKIHPSESTLDFKPLEVDLDELENIRLSEGWLETDTARDAGRGRNEQSPSVSGNTTTPIGDFFASQSVLDLEMSGQPTQQLGRSSSQRQSIDGRRPFSMVETRSIAYSRTSVDLTWNQDVQTPGSILDRGRPVEPKRFVTEPLPKTAGLRLDVAPPQVVSNPAFEKPATPRDLPLRASQYSGNRGNSAVAEQKVLSQDLPAKKLAPNNRHSMYAAVTPSSNSVSAMTTRTTPTLRTTSEPLDRIKAWQKSVTSAPTTAAATGSTSGPGSTLSPAGSAQADIPVRRVSTRGVGSRLAWIRELEEKKSGSANGDLGVLKKQAGSVSDKLAMFEKQAQSASPAVRLNPVARSNSTTSRLSWAGNSTPNRLSWAGVESASSASGAMAATPRTSIDTARSGARPSSVMSYYDESFREKMESVVGQAADKDNPDSEERQRVTTRFVPVIAEKGEKKPQSALPDTAAPVAITTADASEMAPQSSLPETGTSTAGSDKADAELTAKLSTVDLGKSEEEPRSLQEDAVATVIKAETTETPSSSQLAASSSTMEPEKEEKVDTEAQPSQSEEAKASILDSEMVDEASSSTVEPEKEEKVETEPQPSQSEADVSMLDTEKAEETHKELGAGSFTPELEKAEEKPQSSRLEGDYSTAGTAKAVEELPSTQVTSDVAMPDANEAEEELEPTRPQWGNEFIKTEVAPEEDKMSADAPAEPQDSMVLTNGLTV